MSHPVPDPPMDRVRHPLDPWALRETALPSRPATAETLFAVGNGYLGIRGTSEEGHDAVSPGTFINGFHETFPIHHAEEAYGYARVGQTMLPVPDPTVMRIYADAEPLHLPVADLVSYQRVLDLRSGTLERDLVWRTPAGVRVHVVSRRMASFTRRHLAVMELEITPLDGDVPLTVVSSVVNRLDADPEAPDLERSGLESSGLEDSAAVIADPRKTDGVGGHVLQCAESRRDGSRHYLGYRVAASGMTLGIGVDHQIDAHGEVTEHEEHGADAVTREFRVLAASGQTVRLVKYVAYHSSRSSEPGELIQRCRRSLDEAVAVGVRPRGAADGRTCGGRTSDVADLFSEQREWMDGFWRRSDVEVLGRPDLQQAIRFNLFHLAQAAARCQGHGIPAKGLTGTGYSGHYFWDGEVYVLPFYSYTTPEVSRAALRFRWTMLPAARNRAREINMAGALFLWRTISGLEASANYAQGTAQFHIDADIAYALMLYVRTSGDWDFLTRTGIDLLVETARMWLDLGFFRLEGQRCFHIHGVTGPDEYTTVVNDNLYTNIMARGNLWDAARTVRRIQRDHREAYSRMVDRVGLRPGEVEAWEEAAERMYIAYDQTLRVHPQDDQFLSKEVWDLPNTPASDRPLLLHFHPLVIYRYQVIKQTDVVMAQFLHSDEFSAEERLRDFNYYEPLTTGDSSLSAVAQAIVAADVGHVAKAVSHFRNLLYIDLADLHDNTEDGIHIASAGGVWSALVYGFGGMRDDAGIPDLDPRLPEEWEGLRFRLTLAGSRVLVELAPDALELTLEEGSGAVLQVRGKKVEVTPAGPVRIDLEPYSRLSEAPTMSDIAGLERADGTIIEPSLPSHSTHRLGTRAATRGRPEVHFSVREEPGR
ncbi:Kojibiose phosphorylase [Acidipropionibacterium jensenii]|uniref:Kojibiose phosphorylase n=1 Tax=Acidipropionibacterium jensenii TaxID=1749 RepID=A0A3S4V7I2_9ACTN|nr:glycosyl hydrolase family 65 protein [Acidipropionibacterium jensenii]VEI03597.1 Kojibiose phosphorylase [Acidipropionibacterium jensenii]